jgi:sec-independent protein translocase protein TatA
MPPPAPTIDQVFSVSPAEVITIVAVALIVFGPKRLPEISRKAGSILREIRETAADLRRGFEREYEDTVESLGEVRRAIGPTTEGAPPPANGPGE